MQFALYYFLIMVQKAHRVCYNAPKHKFMNAGVLLLTCVEICAGAGGQALGLDMAGFDHLALVAYETDNCATLKANKPHWNAICADVHDFDGTPYRGIDLLAGGVPCPPFSKASKQLDSGTRFIDDSVERRRKSITTEKEN